MATESPPDLQNHHPVEREDSVQPSPSKPVSWRQFLLTDYQRPDNEPSLRDDFFWSVVFFSAWLAIVVVVTVVKVKNWPTETLKYTSNDAVPLEGYHCDCSLPLNLQEPGVTAEAADKTTNRTINFNQCYRRSSLQTISVAQYLIDNTGIDAIVRLYATEDVHHMESEGYVVSQEANELTFRNGEPLGHLYRNDELDSAEEDILLRVPDYILRGDFMDFPRSFVRVAFQYTCKDCTLCSLDHMKGIIWNSTKGRETWVSCYYYQREDYDQCNPDLPTGNPNSYDGKCVMYPTKTFSYVSAIKRFMEAVNKTKGIEDIKPIRSQFALQENWEDQYKNYVSMQSNVVFLNRSYVTKGMLQYGFVESPKGSTLRAWLLTHFPGSDLSCSSVPDLRNTTSVCNGSSICNAFVNTDETVQLKCDDMVDESACKDLVGKAGLSLDNAYGSPDGVSDKAICSSPPFSCISTGLEVPAYKVTRFVTTKTSVDPINSYLNHSILWNGYLLASGICTNTYEMVYRYKRNNYTMLLEGQCTEGTDLCKLTGKFHRLDDFHGDSFQELGKEEFYNNSDVEGLFVCYEVREESWGMWLLDYVNTLFSWMSVLTFLYVSGLYKLVRFLKLKYAHDPNLRPTRLQQQYSGADEPPMLGRRHGNVPPVSSPQEGKTDELRLFTGPPSV